MSCENPIFTLSKPNTIEHPPDKERNERFVLEGSDGVLGCLDDEVPCELGDGRDQTRRRHGLGRRRVSTLVILNITCGVCEKRVKSG